MSNRDSQIVDLLYESRVINQKLQAEKEATTMALQASTMKVQELQERNKALEAELEETRRSLIKAEQAIPVSSARGLFAWLFAESSLPCSRAKFFHRSSFSKSPTASQHLTTTAHSET